MEILNDAEVAEVDKALLTSQDKFLTRIALYSLRSLKQIVQSTGQSIEEIAPHQILDWIEQDETVQQIASDESFQSFFIELVLASLKPLKRAAEAEGVAIEALTVPQVVVWFEQEAKARLERGQGDR